MGFPNVDAGIWTAGKQWPIFNAYNSSIPYTLRSDLIHMIILASNMLFQIELLIINCVVDFRTIKSNVIQLQLHILNMITIYLRLDLLSLRVEETL